MSIVNLKKNALLFTKIYKILRSHLPLLKNKIYMYIIKIMPNGHISLMIQRIKIRYVHTIDFCMVILALSETLHQNKNHSEKNLLTGHTNVQGNV